MIDALTNLVTLLGVGGAFVVMLGAFLWKVVRPMLERGLAAHLDLINALTESDKKQIRCIKSIEESTKASVTQQKRIVDKLCDMEQLDKQMARQVDNIHHRIEGSR